MTIVHGAIICTLIWSLTKIWIDFGINRENKKVKKLVEMLAETTIANVEMKDEIEKLKRGRK